MRNEVGGSEQLARLLATTNATISDLFPMVSREVFFALVFNRVGGELESWPSQLRTPVTFILTQGQASGNCVHNSF